MLDDSDGLPPPAPSDQGWPIEVVAGGDFLRLPFRCTATGAGAARAAARGYSWHPWLDKKCTKPCRDEYEYEHGRHGRDGRVSIVATRAPVHAAGTNRTPSTHGLFDFHFSSKVITIVIPI